MRWQRPSVGAGLGLLTARPPTAVRKRSQHSRGTRGKGASPSGGASVTASQDTNVRGAQAPKAGQGSQAADWTQFSMALGHRLAETPRGHRHGEQP